MCCRFGSSWLGELNLTAELFEEEYFIVVGRGGGGREYPYESYTMK